MSWIQYIIVPIFTSFVGVFVLYLVLLFRRLLEKANHKNQRSPDTEKLKGCVPFTVKSGWKLDGVSNGVPVWKKPERNARTEHGLIGCQALIQSSAENILEELLQLGVFASINSSMQDVSVVGPSPYANNAHQNNLKKDCVEVFESYLPDLDPNDIYLYWKGSTCLKRSWSKSTGTFWMTISPEHELHCNRFGLWICILGKDIEMEGKNKSSGLSHLAIIAAPASKSYLHMRRLKEKISEQILSIREHLDSLYLEQILENISSTPKSAKRNKIVGTVTQKNTLSEKEKGTSNQAKGFPQGLSPVLRKSPSPVLKGSPQGHSPVLRKCSSPAEESIRTSDLHKKEGFGVIESAAEIRDLSSPVGSSRGSLSSEVSEDMTPLQKELEKYKEEIKEAIEGVLDAYNATDDTPRWSYQNMTRGVEIYKMTGDPSCPWECFKGTTEINLPLTYVLQYIMTLEFKKDWDDLFQGGREIEDFDDASKVICLEYKPVWPTSGRDFCILSVTRHVKDNLYVQAVRTVTHPLCPPVKGLVRAEIVTGGLVVEEVSSDPPCCKLTYITRADLKGNLPARLVNKVSSAQPLYTANLREKINDRYERSDPPNNGEHYLAAVKLHRSFLESPKRVKLKPQNITKELRDEEIKNVEDIQIPELKEIQICVEEHQSNGIIKSVDIPEMKLVPFTDNKIGDLSKEDNSNVSLVRSDDGSMQNGDTHQLEKSEDNLYTPRSWTWDDDTASEISYIGSDISDVFEDPGTPLAEQNLDLPRDPHGNVDFRTLANQASANLLEEVLLSSKASVNELEVDKDDERVGEWVYQGIKKEVVIFRKIHAGQNIHSFLGRGQIAVLPVTVWEAIKNPATRFVYDNMLKRTKIVKEIDDKYKIMYYRHETSACFVKQARDFIVLLNERVENKRYVLSGVSVELPECPIERDCTRGTILSSGWIIEPVFQNGKAASLITYLAQVDFGGKLPTRLINHVAKRQPMAIAYLKQYLESAELR